MAVCIHPTAMVDPSLGDGSRSAPACNHRAAVVGRECLIAEHVDAYGVTIGDRVRIDAHVSCVVA
jgi:acetyltransferase-like isoleucine patch superfamily enzyme